jgi:HlyD family secretion protein
VIDPGSRQGFARIALAYAPDLPPGGFASAIIRSGTVVAPMLPESALLSDNQGSYVYVVDKNNKVVRRAVKLGMVTDKGVVIVSGLDGNERVVMRSGSFLAVGQVVKPAAVKP